MSTPINAPAGRDRSHNNSARTSNDAGYAETASPRRDATSRHSKSQNWVMWKNRIRVPMSLFVVTLISLVGLLTSSSEVLSSSSEPSAEPAPINLGTLEAPALEALDFSHTRHVPPRWLYFNQEVKRDCTGCHDFSNPDPQKWPNPMEACTNCHAFDSFIFSGETRTDPASKFPEHRNHAEQACSTCHAPLEALDDVPKFMPIPVVDKQNCTRCHAERDRLSAGANADESTRPKQDAARAARLKLRDEDPNRPVPKFLHSTHLSPEQFSDSSSCETCHVDLARSDADNLGDNQFDAESCRTCHTTEFEVATYLRPSNTAAAFLHEFHMNEDALKEDKQLGEERCLRCHSFDQEKNNFGLRNFLVETGDTHDGCVQCHEHKNWKVTDHGETDKCTKCHAFQEGDSLSDFASMATNRPRAKLLRPRPAGFKFGAHAHQQITAPEGQSIDQKCAECHRANVSELPSMLSNRPFDHASHLSANFGELSKSSCTKCHKEMERESFADLSDQKGLVGTADASATMIYEDNSCAECHGDGFETVLPDNKERTVMWFDHGKHASRKHPKTGKRFDCMTCHVDSPDGSNFSVSIPENVRNCTQCHSHEDHPDETGGFTADMVSSCLDCHRFSPIPERDKPIQVERLRITKKIGFESHDNGGACINCHAMSPEIVGDATPVVLAAAPTERTVQGTRQFRIHQKQHVGVEANNKFFNKGTGQDRQYCVDCHWQSQKRPFSKDSAFKNEPYYGLSKTQLRAEFGDDMTGFPGFAE
ncbi:MAG: hypothetical protein ACI8TQ_000839 [Planctomycetota bacterium]|jgi:hypothetical protein